MKVAPPNIADLFRTGLHGLKKAETQANLSAQKIAAGEVEVKHIVDLKAAETAHKANAAVIRIADRMNGELLDILA
jgi:phosphoribosylformimino-5-aminoimidazole carboxamide ribonucleotide (ProFAR) isomerase